VNAFVVNGAEIRTCVSDINTRWVR